MFNAKKLANRIGKLNSRFSPSTVPHQILIYEPIHTVTQKSQLRAEDRRPLPSSPHQPPPNLGTNRIHNARRERVLKDAPVSNRRSVAMVAPTKKKPKKPRNTAQPSLAACLFVTLLNSDDLHVPSSKVEGYRNKITYSIPLPDPLSPLAQEHVNEVCRIVAEFKHNEVTFREVMVKTTRFNSLMVRITIQKATDGSWKDPFVDYMSNMCPELACLCYNEAETTARPTKEQPVMLLYGDPYVMETTPSGFEYRISPDTFCEVNHEVERLQYDQAKEWIQQFATGLNATLLVSGRDVSSFGLGFGSLQDSNGNNIFRDVLAVQHCPLVHADAVANFERHAGTVETTVFHKCKRTMVDAIASRFKQHQPVVGVMTGGRKGLDPRYLQYLVDNDNICAIIYNSCSTKSLVRDMEGLCQAFVVEDFRSHNFFPGTNYTASLTLLMRRPKTTLIIPVGPAGVGKSSLAQGLIDGGLDISWWHRDIVFSRHREAGMGLNKTKQLVHQDVISFLNKTSGILYVDSTNGSIEARKLYVREANADRVIYISLEPKGKEEEVLEWLLERTRNRLGNNKDHHPSFPETEEEQREKHENIIKGISYPTETSNGGVIVSCNPSEEIGSLLFSLFLELSTSEYIKASVMAELQSE